MNIANGAEINVPRFLSIGEVLPAEQSAQVYVRGEGGGSSASELPSLVATPLVANLRSKQMAQTLTDLGRYESIGVVPSLSAVVDVADPYVQGTTDAEQLRAINHCTVVRVPAGGLDLDEQDSTDAPTLLFGVGDHAIVLKMVDKESGAMRKLTCVTNGTLVVLCPADYARFRYILKPEGSSPSLVVILRCVTRLRSRAEVNALVALAATRKKPAKRAAPKCVGDTPELMKKKKARAFPSVLDVEAADGDGDEEDEEEEEDLPVAKKLVKKYLNRVIMSEDEDEE